MEHRPRPPLGTLALGIVIGAGLMFGVVRSGILPVAPPAPPAPPQIIVGPPATATVFIPPPADERSVRGLPIPLLDSDSTTPDLLVSLTDWRDGQRDTIAYVRGDDRTIRWESPQLDPKEYDRAFAASPRHVYIADGVRLMALDRGDGAVAWERTLADTILNICRDCLQVAGERVVALSQDGTIQAFDAASGAAAWSVRLGQTPRQLVRLGETIGALDYPQGGPNAATLHLFRLADGALERRADTFCPETRSRFAGHPSIYDAIYPEPGGQGAVVFIQRSEGCVLRLDASGAVDWLVPTGETALAGPVLGHPILSPEAIFFGTDEGVVMLDVSGGSVREVARSEDYDLTPLAARDGTLVVEAVRTRGTRRDEVWGLDAATGERRWGHVLSSEERISEPWISGAWSARLVPRGLAVLQAPEGSGQVQLDILDLGDGASVISGTIPVKDSARLGGIVWSDREAWVVLDRIVVLDLASGQTRYVWP